MESIASIPDPVRLVVCVDGTWYTPDGSHGRGQGNISNVYRVCASVKSGLCEDKESGQQFKQEKIYETGLGSTEKKISLGRVKAGAFGTKFDTVIEKLYERCCMLDSRDEIWFYGFSRGAYIVRAIAGLLSRVGSLSSAGTDAFKEDYKRVLEMLTSEIGPGQDHSFRAFNTKPKPKIQFIGVFDTVKAVKDKNIYDISFSYDIQHLRHALALNETRDYMMPEYVFPDVSAIRGNRSLVQAWFVGTHGDLGGSAASDGLSLYPLQWMLLESQSKGLVLEFCHDFDNRVKIDNPLRVVFPKLERDGKRKDEWSCETRNGIKVRMQDLRGVHVLPEYGERYALRLKLRRHFSKKVREPFNTDGELKGYSKFASQGTIIHPSVYQLLEEDPGISLVKNAWSCREQILDCQNDFLGDNGPSKIRNHGFWNERQDPEAEPLKQIRLLVCGNSGIGKSTLINLVFGATVTSASERVAGVHEIEKPLVHENRPDLLIHDSNGFEAGSVEEVDAMKNFIRDRASRDKLEERLHIIWLCIEMGSHRIGQRALIELYQFLSESATDTPIIIVATKSDNFRAIKFNEGRKMYKSLNGAKANAAESMDYADEYSEKQIEVHLKQMENDLLAVENGRFDGCVAVSNCEEYADTVLNLNQVTMNSFRYEQVRQAYVSSQTVDIDSKVHSAILDTMAIYRKVLVSASALGAVPGASTTNRTAAAYKICKVIVNRFGLPTLDSKTVFEIVKSIVWDDFGHNVTIAFAEGLATIGVMATIALGGLPVALTTGAINVPLVVPATARLMLVLAADLILILTRAFKKTILTCVGQPQFDDVSRAASYYRSISSQVHKETLVLVPRRNLVASYRYGKVQVGLEQVVAKYKDLIADDLAVSLQKSLSMQSSVRSSKDDEVQSEIAEIEKDILPSYNETMDLAKSSGFDSAVEVHPSTIS